MAMARSKNRRLLLALALSSLVAIASAAVFFEERFEGERSRCIFFFPRPRIVL